jgi:protein-S-isoprenylcysteine O-methyltransferase Ste14
VIDQLKVIGNVACWGTVVFVWVAGALYNAVRVQRARIRARTTSPTFVAAIVACAIVAVVGQPFLNEYASVGIAWVRIFGLGVLAASTVFTLWARFSLGTMWSVAPRSAAMAGSAATGRMA